MDTFKNEKPQKAWFARNWLWVVPTGCLSMLLLSAGTIGAIGFFVISLLKSSEPYLTAMEIAGTDPVVIEVIGSPIEGPLTVSGNIKLENSNGVADLRIPISGPKGKATIYVVGTKSAGEWSYSKLEVEFENTNQRLTLAIPER